MRILSARRAVGGDGGVDGGDVLDRRLGGRVPEDVVVGQEPGAGAQVDPQVEFVGGEAVVGGDAVVHLGAGGSALDREAVAEVAVGDVAHVDRAGGAQVVEAVVAV